MAYPDDFQAAAYGSPYAPTSGDDEDSLRDMLIEATDRTERLGDLLSKLVDRDLSQADAHMSAAAKALLLAVETYAEAVTAMGVAAGTVQP